MKLRIKMIERNNGTKLYIPQVKNDFSFTILIINILTIMLFGRKFMGGYRGLSKIEQDDAFFGLKAGDITQCPDKEARVFSIFADANVFLSEYAHQHSIETKEEEEEEQKAKEADKLEQLRIKGEKIKKVKYFNVK
jgi:hypothetical protein